MDDQPTVRKKFFDRLPWARELRGAARRLLLKATVAGLGTAALASPEATLQAAAEPLPLPRIVVLNRQRRLLPPKLLLAASTTAADRLFLAGHRSHRSHSSHSSHRSHSSHYSSSGGSSGSSGGSGGSSGTSGGSGSSPSVPDVYVRPSPPRPTPSPPTAEKAPPPTAVAGNQTTVEITAIDLEASWIRGKDKRGNELMFYFKPTTRLRRLAPVDSVTQLGTSPEPFPLRKDQEVLVTWTVDAAKRNVAVQLTIFQ